MNEATLLATGVRSPLESASCLLVRRLRATRVWRWITGIELLVCYSFSHAQHSTQPARNHTATPLEMNVCVGVCRGCLKVAAFNLPEAVRDFNVLRTLH